MKRKTTALLLLLALVSVSGCGVFGTKERVVFVQEATDAGGNPKQILKTTETVTVDAAYFDGERWVVVPNVEIPAGWLVVSPAVMKVTNATNATGDEQ